MPRRKKQLAKLHDDEVVMYEGRPMTKAELLQEMAEVQKAVGAAQNEQLDLLERCG